MDPVEAGEWIAGRPLQLVFLTGLDPSNKLHHKDIVDGFLKSSEEKPPLHINVIFGELDIPSKSEPKNDRGILRREWPLKYLSKVPALIVVFVDLDWNHSSWEEKKTEAESKINSIRAQTRHGTKLALVMIQKSKTCANDSQAADRAHEISQACALSSKQLFVLPTDGDIETYISKLATSFHELCQSFYQQRLKHIRSRNIPNNSPALFVRQQFKLAFISELRQDTHTALRNYRLAYDQCRDTADQWDGVDIFEWRSVVGLLNYKMCELCFLHSTALEAINQMRKHTSIFFTATVGIYPTPQLASIEFLLWKAKENYHFAQLFERAVTGGLCAIATLNPGTHLDQAASMYAAANAEISVLKKSIPANALYPSPDPLEHASSTVFFGQRPWRIGHDGLASAVVEAAAVNAISQRLVINYEGVISLLTAAMSQYKKYGCVRMQRKVMMEMANTCYANNEIPKALQLWSLVTRDNSLPYSVRKDMMHRAAWASYATASIRDFAACCLQLMSPAYSSVLPNRCGVAFYEVLDGKVPCTLFPDDDVSQEQLESYQSQWKQAISDGLDFTLQASRIDYFLEAKVSFIEDKIVDRSGKVNVKVELKSKIDEVFRAKDIIVHIEAKDNSADKEKQVLSEKISLGPVEISNQNAVKKLVQFNFHDVKEEMIFRVVKLVIELGSGQVAGRIEYDEGILNRHEEQVVGNGNVNTTTVDKLGMEDNQEQKREGLEESGGEELQQPREEMPMEVEQISQGENSAVSNASWAYVTELEFENTKLDETINQLRLDQKTWTEEKKRMEKEAEKLRKAVASERLVAKEMKANLTRVQGQLEEARWWRAKSKEQLEELVDGKSSDLMRLGCDCPGGPCVIRDGPTVIKSPELLAARIRAKLEKVKWEDMLLVVNSKNLQEKITDEDRAVALKEFAKHCPRIAQEIMMEKLEGKWAGAGETLRKAVIRTMTPKVTEIAEPVIIVAPKMNIKSRVIFEVRPNKIEGWAAEYGWKAVTDVIVVCDWGKDIEEAMKMIRLTEAVAREVTTVTVVPLGLKCQFDQVQEITEKWVKELKTSPNVMIIDPKSPAGAQRTPLILSERKGNNQLEKMAHLMELAIDGHKIVERLNRELEEMVEQEQEQPNKKRMRGGEHPRHKF